MLHSAELFNPSQRQRVKDQKLCHRSSIERDDYQEVENEIHTQEDNTEICQNHYLALIWDPVTREVSQKSSFIFEHCLNDVFEQAVPKMSHFSQTSMKRKLVHQTHNTSDFQKTKHADAFERLERKRVCRVQNTEQKSTRLHNDSTKTRPSTGQAAHSQPQRTLLKDRGCVTYRADAKKQWEMWFGDAFRAVQQLSCRAIAKEWIRVIHPTKQRTHPYNGKNPKSKQWEGPDATRPPYWPIDIVHKEPDHILKEERVTLLVHILMNTPHREIFASDGSTLDKKISAKTLKQSLGPKMRESQHSELVKKWPIIEHIIDVRMKLEQHKNGEIDDCTMITAPDFSKTKRKSKRKLSDCKLARSLDVSCHEEEDGESIPETVDIFLHGEVCTTTSKLSSSPQLNLDTKECRVEDTSSSFMPRSSEFSSQALYTNQNASCDITVTAPNIPYLDLIARQPRISMLGNSNLATDAVSMNVIGDPNCQQPSVSSQDYLAVAPLTQPELHLHHASAIDFAIKQQQPFTLPILGTTPDENTLSIQLDWNSNIPPETLSAPSSIQQQQGNQLGPPVMSNGLDHTHWQTACEINFTQQAGIAPNQWLDLSQQIENSENMLCQFGTSHPPLILSSDLPFVERDYTDYCQRVFAAA